MVVHSSVGHACLTKATLKHLARLQGNPFLYGTALGLLHIVGPDHLATVVSLSSMMDSGRAFKVGVASGLAHSVGMIIIALMFIPLQKLVSVQHFWHIAGHYAIGVSIMLCGLYFFVFGHKYLEEREDGSIIAKPCCGDINCIEGERCRAPSPPFEVVPPPPVAPPPPDLPAGFERKPDDVKLVRSYCGRRAKRLPATSTRKGTETTPLIEIEKLQQDRTWQGAAIGLIQGACCPVGLMGFGFLTSLGDAHPSATIDLTFVFVFAVVSALGNGIVSASWAALTSQGMSRVVSPKSVYYACCVFSIVLGFVWLLLTKLDKIEVVDFTHSFELNDD